MNTTSTTLNILYQLYKIHEQGLREVEALIEQARRKGLEPEATAHAE